MSSKENIKQAGFMRVESRRGSVGDSSDAFHGDEGMKLHQVVDGETNRSDHVLVAR
jgi:hypothetical protein